MLLSLPGIEQRCHLFHFTKKEKGTTVWVPCLESLGNHSDNLGKGQLRIIFFLTQLMDTLSLRKSRRREEGRKNSSWPQITIKGSNVHTYLAKCPMLRLKDTNISGQLKGMEGTKVVSWEKSVLHKVWSRDQLRRSNSNATVQGKLLWDRRDKVMPTQCHAKCLERPICPFVDKPAAFFLQVFTGFTDGRELLFAMILLSARVALQHPGEAEA